MTSAGLIAHAKEFIGVESISQRYFYIAELLPHIPELAVIVHDDACHLRKFAEKHSGHSALAARLAYPSIKYIIDKMHAKGHTDAWCLAHCHPDVPENALAVLGVRTPACETANSVFWCATSSHIAT